MRKVQLMACVTLQLLFVAVSVSANEVLDISMSEVEQLQSHNGTVLFDANLELYYTLGYLKGAKLVDYSNVSTKDLPMDKNAHLTFYCKNKTCPSAPLSAKKAIELGYRNVHVMPDGIIGWVASGRPYVRGKNYGKVSKVTVPKGFILGNSAEVFSTARISDKPIIIDFHDAQCPPCETVEKTVLGNPHFFAISKLFLKLKLESDTPSFKELAKRYSIVAMPTILFLNSTGKEIGRVTGLKPLDEYVSLAKSLSRAPQVF